MTSDSASSPSLLMSGYDIREMSFQNVVDRILRPSGIKMGGFPVEMFVDLTEAEQQKFMCNICYMMANECCCCDNKHVFCRSCILAWSMTFGENSQKCPFCRCNQTEYPVDKELDDQLKDKMVCCRTDDCSYKAPLRFFLQHSHGRTNYSNADVDFSRIQLEQSRLFPLPLLAAVEGDNVAAGAMDIREQLLQGRMMIHQMMLLMHLEMQLRQQALVSYQEAQDPAQRMQRLDDVMALNEQLNEVGSILGVLLNTPLDRGASVRLAATRSMESPRAGRHSPSTVGGRFGAPAGDESALGSLLPRFRFRVLDTDTDDTDDDGDDDVTDDSMSFAASNVADANDSDIFEEDFGPVTSSSDSSVRNSYNFDGLTPPHRQPARITISHSINTERVAAGILGSGSSSNGVSRSSVVSGNGANRRPLASVMPVPSSTIASNGQSSVILSRRRDRPTTPQWMTVEQTPVSVTVNELRSSAGVRSQPGIGTTMPSQTVTLPQILSAAGNPAAASQVPATQNVDHVRPGRQLTGSGSSGGTPRHLEPLSGNRSYGSTAVVTDSQQQALPSRSHVATSSTSGGGTTNSINASQQPDMSYRTDRSNVLTEPWPVLSSAEPPRTSTFVSTNRLAATRPSHLHGGLARNHTNTDSHLATLRPTADRTMVHDPRRTVPEMHNSRPALQLRRSSVRNPLGRPAGPASVLPLRPSAPQRMVPLPHPLLRTGRQQGAGAAGSRTYASNEVLRPRRRSEIAHEIMFSQQKDTEQ